MIKKAGVWSCIILLFCSAVFFGCRQGAVSPAADKTVVAADEVEALKRLASANGCELFDGLYITELFPFSGRYPEDGSDRETQNTAAVRLVNLSTVSYRYVAFTLTCGEENYSFFISTLLPGAKATVLETDGLPLVNGEISSAEVTAIEAFDQLPSVYLDVFRISYADGALTLENRTDADRKNVCVYYKSVDENGYFGGITYKVAIGDLTPGQSVTLAAEKLSATNSRIVFVTYDD
ncbi:MAG: hypothetical protein IJT27_01245 [Clostridia bacterium]|nr:hypothetical protein [Clostridia bacterium]